MDNEEILAVEETDEKVETQTTEENVEGIELTDTPLENTEEKEEVKTYTQEEMEDIIQRRLARQKDKLERDYTKELARYKRTEEILNAGLGTNNIEDANAKMVDYYEKEGIKIPDHKEPGLTQKQIEILGKAEADEIIAVGDEKEELNRLLKINVNDMSPMEKVIYKRLYEKVSDDDRKQELVKQGIDLSILNDQKFQEFEKQFNKETNLGNVVDLYKKLNPEEKPQKIGSMVSNDMGKIKEYYTPEEISKLTEEDLENPAIWEAVRKSQTKNYKPNY